MQRSAFGDQTTTSPIQPAVRVLIAGGGTGGHIIPALAIADELQARHAAEILFVGTPRGLESRLVPQAGYRLELIRVGQLNHVPLATRLRTLIDLPMGLIQCVRLLRKFRPGIVIGVGGYASGPVMGAAILLGIPTLAFESNAIPGLANRLVGARVKAAAVAFEPAARYFRHAQITGIPVRAEFFHLAPRPAGAPPHLLVFGGSQGARALNAVMPKIVAQLLASVPGLTFCIRRGRAMRRRRWMLTRRAVLRRIGGRWRHFWTTCRDGLRRQTWCFRAAGRRQWRSWLPRGNRRC